MKKTRFWFNFGISSPSPNLCHLSLSFSLFLSKARNNGSRRKHGNLELEGRILPGISRFLYHPLAPVLLPHRQIPHGHFHLRGNTMLRPIIPHWKLSYLSLFRRYWERKSISSRRKQRSGLWIGSWNLT